MTTTFTVNKHLSKPANGDDVNTWDVPLNANSDVLDASLGGLTALNATAVSGNVTLTTTQYRPPIVEITGTLTGNVSYQLPASVGGFWYIFNNTTGAFNITWVSQSGGTFVNLPQGYTSGVICDGTNVGAAITTVGSAGGSSTAVQYNVGGVLAGSNNLQFNGTTLALKGVFAIAGASSGAFGLQVPAAAGATTYTLPATPGSNGQFLTSDGAGNLSWTGAVGGVTSFSGGSTGLTPSSPTGGAVSLAGTLATGFGGTGLTSFTSGKAVYASSASALTVGTLPITAGGTGLAVTPTNGQVLIGTGAGYALSTLTAGAGVTITNGTGTITLSAVGVTSVNVSGGGTGLVFSGGPITSSGTITASGTLGTANGGTGLVNYTSGGAVYATGASTLTSGTLPVASGGTGATATPSNGQILIGNGAAYSVASLTAGTGVAITPGAGSLTISATGTGGTVTSVGVSGGSTGLTTSGGPVTSSGNITLAGTLAIANGGTNATSAAGAAANLGALQIANNLSDVNSAASSRTNLGLGTAAVVNTGTSGATVPLLNGNLVWAGTATHSGTVTFTLAPVFTDAPGTRTALGLGTAATAATGTSGATLPFANGTNTWASTQTFTAAPVFTDAAGSRTALGLGSAATANTGTSGATVPLLNGTLTFSGVVTHTAGVQTTPSAVTFNATTMTLNCALSNVFATTFTANVTSAPTLSNPGDGQTINWFITQDGSGGHTMTWPASFKWPGGSAGVLSTGVNAVDLLVATFRSATSSWYATLTHAFS